MQRAGFPPSVPCGKDGPEAWRHAEEWNAKWDKARRGDPDADVKIWPRGSLGEAFERFRRTEEWRAKAASTRSEWDLAWARIKTVFGDVDPSTVSLEDVSTWYHGVLNLKGVDTAWRAMKVWRSLWQVAAAMNYCDKGKDPSAGVKRRSPPKRALRWREGEVVRLVKAAWRKGHKGLACIIAVAWDTQLSPGDVRALTPQHVIVLDYPSPRGGTEPGLAFSTGRAKTGRAAIGTLSRRTRALVAAYHADFVADLLPGSPLFRATDGEAFKTKEVLARAFSRLRERLITGDSRTLMDMRRSGAVEAMAGGVHPGHLAAKMANSINEAQDLQATYIPVDAEVVKLADEARRRGRSKLRNS